MVVLETVCVAFAMFSALPVPHVDWNERNMRYAMAAFPLIGAVIGALLMSVLCTLDGYGVPLTFLHKLPLFELGFAWVLPSVLFGAVAAVLPHRKEKAGKAEPACACANGKQG